MAAEKKIKTSNYISDGVCREEVTSILLDQKIVFPFFLKVKVKSLNLKLMSFFKLKRANHLTRNIMAALGLNKMHIFYPAVDNIIICKIPSGAVKL